MAKISVNYKIGAKVVHKGGGDYIVTAIHIRGRGRSYECSYVNNDGNPTNVVCEECEIESANTNKPLGFRK